MSGPDRLRAALSGADVVAFAPLAWARLPEFLHVTGPGAFWLDAGTAQRLLADAASVCAADASVVPLLPRPRSPLAAAPVATTPDATASHAGAPITPPAGAHECADRWVICQQEVHSSADEIAARPEVAATAGLLRRLADTGVAGLVAELPPLADLAGMLPGAAREDLEDALTDLARAGLEAGAQAVCVRGAPDAGVAETVEALAPLADYYGAAALGVDGGRGWAAGGRCPVGVLGRDGRWPDLARGVVLTAGDVTEWWTPQQARARLREPAAARRLADARAPASTEDAG